MKILKKFLGWVVPLLMAKDNVHLANSLNRSKQWKK